jgi:hypothetical protein
LARGCEAASGGIGVGAYGARIELRRFRIERSALAAGQIAADGCVALADGAIAHNPIGMNVQVVGFELAKILDDGVEYRDNEANLASLELPVPEPPRIDL